MRSFTCSSCKEPLVPRQILEQASGYSSFTDSGGSICTQCRQGLEFRVASGKLEIGYTYWAGSMHFEGVLSARVAGLRRISAGDTLMAELGGVTYPLSPPRDTSRRSFIPAKAGI